MTKAPKDRADGIAALCHRDAPARGELTKDILKHMLAIANSGTVSRRILKEMTSKLFEHAKESLEIGPPSNVVQRYLERE